MLLVAWAASFLLGSFQDPPDLPKLVEALRSERVDERESAAEELRARGAAAVPLLQKAALSSDAEVAARARQILEDIEYSTLFSAPLRRAFPRVNHPNFRTDPAEWTRVFWEAAASPSLGAEDVNPLVLRAYLGAPDGLTRIQVYTTAIGKKCRSASELVPLMIKDPEAQVRFQGARLAGRHQLRTLIPDLLELARQGPQAARDAALESLVQLKPNEAADSCVALLREPDVEQWRSIVPLLQSLDREKLVPLLLPHLQDSAFGSRWIAASVLAELRVEAATGELRRCLGDSDAKIRGNAVGCLGRWDARRFAKELMPLCQDPDDGVAAMAIWAVSRPENAGMAVPELLEIVRGTEGARRGPALRALVGLGEREAVPELIKDLRAPATRDNAIRGLVTLRARGAAHEIEKCLGEKDGRAEAALALGFLGVRESRPLIRKLLGDSEFLVRHRAVHALWLLEDRDCGGLLLEHLSEVPEVSRCVALMMIDLEIPGVLPDLTRLATDPKSGADVVAVRILGHLGTASQQGLLRGLLGDPRAPMREAAAEALGRLGGREGIPTLVALLGKEDLWLRCTALRTLGRMEAKEATGAMLRVLEGDGPDRLEALSALTALRAQEAAAPAWEILRDEKSGMDLRREAVRTVSILEGRSAEAGLVGFMNDPDARVQYEASVGLCRLGLRCGVPTLLPPEGRVPEGPLFALNALRSPEVWGRLDPGTRESADRMDLKEALDRMARETGLPVEAPPEGPIQHDLDLGQCRLHRMLRTDPGVYPGAHLPPGRAGWARWEVILERDRVRVLPRQEALEFWRAWWGALPEAQRR